MTSPRTTDDDELPALPPLDGDVEDGPRALDEDEADDEDETVGLDVSTGDEELEAELDGVDEEGVSHLDGSEPGEIDDGNHDDLAVGEDERGWASFAETDDGPEEELEGPDGEALATTDRGDEGLVDDEPVRGTEGDEADLPPSDGAVVGSEARDLPDELLDVREAGEVELADLPVDVERRLSGAELPPALPASRVTATWLDVDGVVAALGAAGDGVLAAGTSLVQLSAAASTSTRLAARGLEVAYVTSLVAHPDDPRRIVAGTRLGGAFASRDGGESFAPVNTWRRERRAGADAPLHATESASAFHVALEKHESGVRLWGLAGGALYRSEDFGETWAGPLLVAPIAAFAACPLGEGGVAAVALAQGSARLLCSRDGGLAWSSRALPVPMATRAAPMVARVGDAVVVAFDRDPAGALLLDAERGGERRLPELTPVIHLALTANREVWAVLFFPGSDRSVLCRAGEGAVTTVADVAALGAQRARAGDLHDEGDGRVLALHVRGDTAWLATPRGVLRVVVHG